VAPQADRFQKLLLWLLFTRESGALKAAKDAVKVLKEKYEEAKEALAPYTARKAALEARQRESSEAMREAKERLAKVNALHQKLEKKCEDGHGAVTEAIARVRRAGCMHTHMRTYAPLPACMYIRV
jgi:chromosome segregation ATPase